MTASEKAKKLHLWSLIKSVGLYYGEKIEDLEIYGKEVYENEAYTTDQKINCFQSIKDQYKYAPISKGK